MVALKFSGGNSGQKPDGSETDREPDAEGRLIAVLTTPPLLRDGLKNNQESPRGLASTPSSRPPSSHIPTTCGGGSAMSAKGDDPTDVTEDPWAFLHSLLPPRNGVPEGPGRPPGEGRHVIHGMISLSKTGSVALAAPQLGEVEERLERFETVATRRCGGPRADDAPPSGEMSARSPPRALCRPYRLATSPEGQAMAGDGL